MNGHTEQITLGDSEPDLRNEPGYLVFAAQLDAETDYLRGISMHDGIARLYRAQMHCEVYMTKEEIHAYMEAYQRMGWMRMASDIERINARSWGWDDDDNSIDDLHKRGED